MISDEVDVAVVGAGVAGLSAALALRERGREPLVLEASARVGGLVATEALGGFLVEHGPDGLLATEGETLPFLRALGLEGEIVRGGEGKRRAFVSTEGGLVPMPEGLFRFERKLALSMLRTPLLSCRAKLRLFYEPFAPRGSAEDESVAGFFERRLGVEVATRVVEPMLRGIFGAPATTLGIASVMPAIHRMEREHGALGIALFAARRSASAASLLTFRDGMQSVPQAMLAGLTGRVVRRASVERIERVSGGYRLSVGGRGQLRARSIVLACPAWHAARLLEPLDARVGERLGGIESNRADVVSLGFDALGEALPDGTGYVAGPSMPGVISACTFVSRKWHGRAPSGGSLLRVVAARGDLDDAALLEAVRAELTRTLGITRAPTFVRMRRLASALPIYGVGHIARIAALREASAEALPGVAFAGNAYDGIGVPSCILSGARAGAVASAAA
jgi:oxygen-dependent protoporphyrinogen oxidase